MKESALGIYYTEVSLDSVESSNLLNSRLSQGQALSHVLSVKKLNIGYDANIQDIFPFVLAGLFRNVTSIDFSKSHLCYQYMSSLAFDFSLSCRSMKLQEIAPPSTEAPQDLISLYYQACFTFRHTLRRYYTDCFVYMPDHPQFTLWNTLPNFAKLTHLAIKNSRQLPGTTSDLFLLVRFCPNLISFKLVSESAPMFTTPAPLDYPNTSLKTLDLQFPSMSSSYFDYFVTHLASYHRLETLNLHLYEQFIHHWIQDNDLNILLQFASILTRSTQSVNIQMSSFNDPKMIYQVTETPIIRETMRRYWSFIHALKQDRILHSVIATHQDVYSYTSHSVQMMQTALCLTETGYQVWPYVDYKMDLSSDKQSTHGPHIVDSLYVKGVRPEKAITTLRYVLTNYAGLQYLSICLEEKYHKESTFFALDSNGGSRLSKVTLHYCKALSDGILDTMAEFVSNISEIMWTEQSLKSCGQFNTTLFKHLKKLTVNFTERVMFQKTWCLYLMVHFGKRKPSIFKSANLEGWSTKPLYNFLPSSAIEMSSHFHESPQSPILPTMLIVNAEVLEKLVLADNGTSIETLRF
ncbi:hypothetical protein INT47_003266 [Mucor saturninus]|uniref:Uncharacterized protein n=1 Tax=Mucor saturninus TaxID=64648 RepID=A0A8H7RFM0_9FUNG|nr:hypothetical protein INT47_003266 [Mucor saturninus]